MTEASIRLECYRLATDMKVRSSKISEAVPDVAKEFADFCKDDEVKLAALKLACEKSRPRLGVRELLVVATDYVKFANPPKPEPVVVPARKAGGRKKTHSR